MSGFVMCMGPCLVCKNLFSFNPHRVPSYRVKGEREPICESCMKRINEQRQERGQDPFPINPDAYEALPEEEL